MSKFYMLNAAVLTGHQIWLVIFAVICAAISAYYYFRIIQSIFFKDVSDDVVLAEDITPAFKILLIITSILIIGLGLFPTMLTNWLYF